MGHPRGRERFPLGFNLKEGGRCVEWSSFLTTFPGSKKGLIVVEELVPQNRLPCSSSRIRPRTATEGTLYAFHEFLNNFILLFSKFIQQKTIVELAFCPLYSRGCDVLRSNIFKTILVVAVAAVQSIVFGQKKWLPRAVFLFAESG